MSSSTASSSTASRAQAAPALPVTWHRREPGSWLAQHVSSALSPTPGPLAARIEARARATHELGPQPLWEGYGANNRFGPTRRPNDVRTASVMGDWFTELVRARRPEVVVELGTAFGVSGMYFLAGLEANGAGCLYTFEPNERWAILAQPNLAAIGARFRLTRGTFEARVDEALAGRRIDLAFIDAIHTPEFVLPQLELILARSSHGALVLLDDIHFSPDMRACWAELAESARFRASLSLAGRVGVLEL